jgi:hypothetical protein
MAHIMIVSSWRCAWRSPVVSLAIAISLAAPRAVGAQEVGGSLTLGDILDSLHRAADVVHLATVQPQAGVVLDSLTHVLDNARARGLTVSELTAVIEQQDLGFRTVARWDAEVYRVLAQDGFRQALIGLQQIAMTVLRPLLSAQLPETAVRTLFAPISALGSAILQHGREGNQERLRRYEVKYGPTAPRLNIGEVALNYAAQRWLPGFKASADGLPSPYELVTAYRTAELTATRDSGQSMRAHFVSGAQLGFRRYNFDPNWGTGGKLAQLIRPGDSSLGMYVVAPRDLPLQRVWGSGVRGGAFVGWGGVHAAYVFGKPQRIIFGNSLQILPYMF